MKVTTDLFETLRQPEYTGNRRCTPCTWVNSVIAVVLSAAAGSATATVAPDGLAVAAGGTVLGLSAAAIYFRGYLVPGTPELTKQYLPEWLLQKLGKRSEPEFEESATSSTEEEVEFDVDPIEGLQESGAIEECEHVDDLCLNGAFEERWYDRFDAVAARENRLDLVVEYFTEYFPVTEDVMEVVKYRPGTVDFGVLTEDAPAVIVPERDGDSEASDVVVGEQTPDDKEEIAAYIMYLGSDSKVIWPSHEAILAELAAEAVLEEEWEQWSDLGAKTRSHILSGLRLFMTRCPSCGTDLAQTQDPFCCGPGESVQVTCEECDSIIFENKIDDDADEFEG